MSEREEAFYHGTIENIPEGSLVEPRTKGGHAWATTDLNSAVEHTQKRIHSGVGQSDENKTVNHGKIYAVVPVDERSVETETMSGIKNAVASRKGFKVSRQIASVLPRRDNE
jgi:hypothetical protein